MSRKVHGRPVVVASDGRYSPPIRSASYDAHHSTGSFAVARSFGAAGGDLALPSGVAKLTLSDGGHGAIDGSVSVSVRDASAGAEPADEAHATMLKETGAVPCGPMLELLPHGATFKNKVSLLTAPSAGRRRAEVIGADALQRRLDPPLPMGGASGQATTGRAWPGCGGGRCVLYGDASHSPSLSISQFATTDNTARNCKNEMYILLSEDATFRFHSQG